jgi:4-carboxymuconolactone decarboxylase
MKQLAPFALALTLATPGLAQEAEPAASAGSGLASVAPALAEYTNSVLVGDLWQRPQLAPRDRSIVTVSALIARGHTADLRAEVNRAIANAVTPVEISEIVTHLAFYAGWGTALAAAPIIEQVFAENHVLSDDLPKRDVELLPQNAEGEAARVAAVQSLVGDAAPGLAEFTTDPLFSELWLRPDLAPRDRSLVTITSLIALGQTGQLAGHLNRALDNGLSGEQAGEVVAHLAFYSGWPTAFSAGPVVKEVLESRAD